jgi:pimeloyl-ACP methyl ester carboxylesterase
MNKLRVGGWVALLLLLVFSARSQTPGPSNPPPPGTLVDVGGYRVHLYCIGQGTPTVIIVGGAFSFDWQLVQSEVAKFTRVCTFDPSGTAWSDPFKVTTEKSTPACADRVDEIHRLVTKAPIDGPYVLVGFSVGGLWARIYAAEYPENILGMVIVDHAFQGVGAPPHPASSSGSLRGYKPPALISQAPIAIGFEDNLNFSKLPQRDRELHTWALSQHPILVDYPMVADCFSAIERMTAGRQYPLGKMHLVVISTPNEARGYAELQAKLLTLSHNSERIIAWNSTHMVPIDEPEIITEAIHEVVDASRKPSAP